MPLVELLQHLVDQAHRRINQPILEKAAQPIASHSQARDKANEEGVSAAAARAWGAVTLREPYP
jgi:hypothetical protein